MDRLTPSRPPLDPHLLLARPVQLHHRPVHARVQKAAEGDAARGGPPARAVHERRRQRRRREPEHQNLVRHLGVGAVDEEDLDALLVRLLSGGDGGDALGHEAGGGGVALRARLHGAPRHRRGEGPEGQDHAVRARRTRDVRARPQQQHRAGEPRHHLLERARRLVERAPPVAPPGGVLGQEHGGGASAHGGDDGALLALYPARLHRQHQRGQRHGRRLGGAGNPR
eukprot:1006148-Prorocentrum_minimum.AAC.1